MWAAQVIYAVSASMAWLILWLPSQSCDPMLTLCLVRRQEMAEEVRSERQRRAGSAVNGRKSEQILIRHQESRALNILLQP